MKRLGFTLGFIAVPLAANAAHLGSVRAPKRSMRAPKRSMRAPKVVSLRDGLRYVDLVVGKGARPRTGQLVTVTYVGTLQNGQKFDASADHGGTFSFPLGAGRVIKGWDEGVATMRVGGKRKLVVPPELGYGAQGAGGVIPPNATLTFVIELLKAEG